LPCLPEKGAQLRVAVKRCKDALKEKPVRGMLLVSMLAGLAACAHVPDLADAASDAPDVQWRAASPFRDATSYGDALQVWKTPQDINAWIAARFEYNTSRAMLLSETQRNKAVPLSISRPEDFFAAPSGICVDLSRFAVGTLRADSKRPGYVAGPYESTRAFVDEYTRYRGREVISFRELDSYQRKQRTLAAKELRG
jgi:hypothetical protein